MRRMGSEGMGIDTIVASGRDNTLAILARTTNRRVATGEHVLLTIAPRYEGYHGAIGRVAAVGAIDPQIERAMDVAIEAQDHAAAALRPGATGAEIDAIARAVCREAGLERHFAYSGVHSVGLAEFEPPILTSSSHEKLSADMIFSIDIPIFFAPWGGLRVEDGFLITADRTEPLQAISRSICRVN
jgi:Xaa-Pro aminopeptidase